MVFSFGRRTEQALFLLVLVKDYGATRSGGAANLRQVNQTAKDARHEAKTAPKARNMKARGKREAKRARRPWILSKKGVAP